MPQLAGLYAIIDPALCGGRDPVAVGRAALDGGATILQWRDKLRDKGEQLVEARALYGACRRHDAAFIVNDHADLAMVLSADGQPGTGAIGVHVGQKDLPLAAVRAIVPEWMLVGVSTNNPEEALLAERGGATYVAVGDLFGTTAKQGTRSASPARLSEVKAAVHIPVFGIGGINLANLGQVLDAGADGIAVISAVCAAPDPAAASRELVAALRR